MFDKIVKKLGANNPEKQFRERMQDLQLKFGKLIEENKVEFHELAELTRIMYGWTILNYNNQLKERDTQLNFLRSQKYDSPKSTENREENKE